MHRIGLVVLALTLVGCATAEPSVEEMPNRGSTSHRIPPEVTDHTVDKRPDFVRSVRPRVDVSLDRGGLLGVDTANYEATVKRRAQQCYSRTIRTSENQLEGSVVYEVLVTRNGHVAGTDMMSSRLESDTIRSCVERIIGRLRFDVPVRNRPVFRLFFRLDFYLETLIPDEPPV